MNDRRERFCREYVIDLNATQAYIRSGYSEKGASQSAEKLLRNTEVKKRIEELLAELREKHAITVENIAREMISDRENAREQGQYSVALKANVEIARLHGLYLEDNNQRRPRIEGKTTAELIELAKQLAEGLDEDQPSTPH